MYVTMNMSITDYNLYITTQLIIYGHPHNTRDRGSTVVKVAGSIPAGVSGFFIDIKSF